MATKIDGRSLWRVTGTNPPHPRQCDRKRPANQGSDTEYGAIFGTVGMDQILKHRDADAKDK